MPQSDQERILKNEKNLDELHRAGHSGDVGGSDFITDMAVPPDEAIEGPKKPTAQEQATAAENARRSE